MTRLQAAAVFALLCLLGPLPAFAQSCPDTCRQAERNCSTSCRGSYMPHQSALTRCTNMCVETRELCYRNCGTPNYTPSRPGRVIR